MTLTVSPAAAGSVVAEYLDSIVITDTSPYRVTTRTYTPIRATFTPAPGWRLVNWRQTVRRTSSSSDPTESTIYIGSGNPIEGRVDRDESGSVTTLHQPLNTEVLITPISGGSSSWTKSDIIELVAECEYSPTVHTNLILRSPNGPILRSSRNGQILRDA